MEDPDNSRSDVVTNYLSSFSLKTFDWVTGGARLEQDEAKSVDFRLFKTPREHQT